MGEATAAILNASAAPKLFDQTAPLVLPETNRWSFHFWMIAPVLEGRYAFLGEAGTKWVAVSRQRFTQINAVPQGVEIEMAGATGETVRLGYTTLDSGGNPKPTTFFNCTITASGRATARIPAHSCA